MAAKLKTKSDVPRFLTMLKENHIPAEYCVGLFSSWCSCEGTAITAEKCMMIQTKYGMTMTAVWEWVCTNDPCPDTDWPEEVDRFKEEIMTATKLNYNQIIIDASNRFHAIVNACMNSKDYPTIAGLTCSSMYSSEKDIPKAEEEEEKEHPVLDPDFCFSYRGYQFELSSCNNITCKTRCLT